MKQLTREDRSLATTNVQLTGGTIHSTPFALLVLSSGDGTRGLRIRKSGNLENVLQEVRDAWEIKLSIIKPQSYRRRCGRPYNVTTKMKEMLKLVRQSKLILLKYA